MLNVTFTALAMGVLALLTTPTLAAGPSKDIDLKIAVENDADAMSCEVPDAMIASGARERMARLGWTVRSASEEYLRVSVMPMNVPEPGGCLFGITVELYRSVTLGVDRQRKVLAATATNTYVGTYNYGNISRVRSAVSEAVSNVLTEAAKKSL